MDAAISSIDAPHLPTPEACSPADCDRLCAVALTSDARNDSAFMFTSDTMADNVHHVPYSLQHLPGLVFAVPPLPRSGAISQFVGHVPPGARASDADDDPDGCANGQHDGRRSKPR